MTESSGSYRLSSARRRGPGDSPVVRVAMVLAIVLGALVAVRMMQQSEPEIVVPPTPIPSPTATPGPTRTPTPTATLIAAGSQWVDATLLIPPSPTPPALRPAAPEPTRAPRPTPSISQCTAFSFTTIQTFTPSAQVKVDIRVDNRCPYDLGPDNLWFEITGWRDGSWVQSVRGHPFETIRRGHRGDLAIGLPGSLDWYDEIEVVVLD
jgi:hypothetical protein